MPRPEATLSPPGPPATNAGTRASVRRTSGAAALARRHWLFLVLFAAGAVLRAMASLGYRPALLFYGDSYYYLHNAHRLIPNGLRPAAYPALLKVLLALGGGHLAVVPAFQHLLGLALGVLAYAVLRRLGLPAWLAALGAAPLLLDTYLIDLEQYVMAETMFDVLVGTAFALLVWWRRPPVTVVATAGLLLALATLARTVGIVLIAPALLFVLGTRLGGARAVALVVAFALPIGLYAGWFHHYHRRYTITSFDGHFLYGRVVDFATCQGLAIPAYERMLCPAMPPADRPGPNWYVWNAASPASHVRPPKGITRDRALLQFSLAVLRHQPLTFARVVGADFLHLLAPGHRTGRWQEPVRMWQFGLSVPDQRRAALRAQRRFGPPVPPTTRIDRPVAQALIAYQRAGYTPGPLLALCIALGLGAGAVGLRRAAPRRLRAEVLLYTLSGAGLALTAMATSMFDYRYLLPSIPLLAPAGALGAWILALRIAGRRAAGGGGPEPVAASAAPEEPSPSLGAPVVGA